MSKNHWDQRFSSDDYIYGKEVNDFIEEMSEIIPENSFVACFAEGEGRNAVFLAQQGHDVTAYDQSTAGIQKMKQLAEEKGVEVDAVITDLTKERVKKDHYDAAVMVFGHVDKQDQPFLLRNLLGCVKPGGYVMFEVYSEAQINYKTGGPRTVDALYDPAAVLELVDWHECLHFYYGEAERHEGDGHTGLSHVVQVLVRKK